MALIAPFLERPEPLPRTFPLTIIARDPSISDRRSTDPKRKILTAEVQVPASRLERGPRGPRFQVVDYDASTRQLRKGADLAPRARPAPGWGFSDRYKDAEDDRLLSDARFRAQNVYAIAARTLAVFEFALGRPIPWAFGSPQLYLVPTAFVEANAYYADDDQALYFGYFPGAAANQTVFTCLSHDIVAHETTHAILDGLRRRFDTPGLPDQAGFHEGFADIVALLSILSAKESIAALIGDPRRERIAKADLSAPRLRESVLLTLGKQFGDALHLNRGGGLRRSVQLDPTTAWKDPNNREWEEPHRRGEILAAAVMHSFLAMWTRRLESLDGGKTLDRERAAEEGATTARHLLEMVIRAIDYCPPVEFEFEDFLAAILVSDREVAPDDELDYRGALEEAFGGFGITAAIGTPIVLATAADRPSYRNFSYGALRSDPDEAFRFLWENAGFLGITPAYYLHVENVRPSLRVGPRGFVVGETVVDYVQELIISRAELEQLARSDLPGFAAPAVIPEATHLKIWGGGTVIFDEFGGVKYHQTKQLTDWSRQQRRLEYLVRQGLWDTKGRLGFSLGAPLGQRFAQFHGPVETVGEEW
jgi:hypothetical protein